jgi:N6-L-threonylcarbamoyladenine synthase
MNHTILAIESSCDDTSASIIQNGKILSNIIETQEVHREWGGIVPELASRTHQQKIVPVVDMAFKKAGISKSEIDAIAFTRGPGLIGSLMVGASFAKGLALALDVPLIAVHHMQAHILAHFIDEPQPSFPFLCLTVSGGHTQIVKVSGFDQFKIIGNTLDDAAGEAFDKTGKLLGLPYPGGPEMDKLAKLGDKSKFKFTEPRVGGLDFSFSGVKSSVLYFIQKQTKINPNFIEENLNDLCASIQERIVSILIKKLKLASTNYQIKQLAIAGGVSANSSLRAQLQELEKNGYEVFLPDFQYCVDNAGMIARTASFLYENKIFADHSVEPKARWSL